MPKSPEKVWRIGVDAVDMNLLLMRFLSARSFWVLDIASFVHPAISRELRGVLTVGGVVRRDSADKGGAIFEVIANVEIDVIRHQALESVHVGSRFVCSTHVSRDLSISLEEFKQHLLWVLEGLLEFEPLVPALGIEKGIVL